MLLQSGYDTYWKNVVCVLLNVMEQHITARSDNRAAQDAIMFFAPC